MQKYCFYAICAIPINGYFCFRTAGICSRARAGVFFICRVVPFGWIISQKKEQAKKRYKYNTCYIYSPEGTEDLIERDHRFLWGLRGYVEGWLWVSRKR